MLGHHFKRVRHARRQMSMAIPPPITSAEQISTIVSKVTASMVFSLCWTHSNQHANLELFLSDAPFFVALLNVFAFIGLFLAAGDSDGELQFLPFIIH